jgi:hypothetical protein
MQPRQRNHRRRGSIGKFAGSLCVLAAVILSGASTVDANRGQPNREVPISGVMSSVDTIGVGRCVDLGWQWNYVSVGTARVSHLGSGSVVVDHCSKWTVPGSLGAFGEGTITLTAANGDQLVLNDWGTFEVIDGLAYIDLFWEVNGDLSTGRFAGATGSGFGDPVGNLRTEPSTTAGSMWGTIAYDASNRAH